MLSEATRIDARIPSPASIVTTRRSIMSGICLSMTSKRLRFLSSTQYGGANQPAAPAAAARITAKMSDPPIAGTSQSTKSDAAMHART